MIDSAIRERVSPPALRQLHVLSPCGGLRWTWREEVKQRGLTGSNAHLHETPEESRIYNRCAWLSSVSSAEKLKINNVTKEGMASGNRIVKAIMSRLFSPVDIASLVYFRIAFGAIMLWEVYRYFMKGWIPRYYIDPTFFFHYFGFDWITPWAGNGMYIHFIVLGILAACIMLGLFYRVAATLFFLGFTYVFLLDQANYLNHFYLVSLVSFLMIFVPAHRAFSWDVIRKPSLRSDTAPAWALWILLFQIGIAYFYGGIAKLNWDWLAGEPMRMWIAHRGAFYMQEWVVYFISYGGLLFDLLVVPALLWRRTRLIAFILVVWFNLANADLFSIGIFPWFMIAATALFFPPDWPRRIINRIKGKEQGKKKMIRLAKPRIRRKERIIAILLPIYVLIQLLVPFRHLLYPGNVSWTEEGHRFSWHMKLRDKEATSVRFFASDSTTNETWGIDPDDYLSSRQMRKMPNRPDMILQFSHHAAEELRKKGYEDVEIRAEIMMSLNAREPQPFIDPNVNLAAEERNLRHADWILPLEE